MNLLPLPTQVQNDTAVFGVVICKINEIQNHLGFVFVIDGELKILHHGISRVIVEVPGESYFWSPLGEGFEEIHVQYLLAEIRRIAEKSNNSSIVYGFDSVVEYFKDGMIDQQYAEHGLTCATFVLSIFYSFGFEILIYDEWPVDDKINQDWQEKILNRFEERNRFSSKIINEQRKNLGARRFLPQEVFAASQLRIPVGYKEASLAGETINKLLQAETKK